MASCTDLRAYRSHRFQKSVSIPFFDLTIILQGSRGEGNGKKKKKNYRNKSPQMEEHGITHTVKTNTFCKRMTPAPDISVDATITAVVSGVVVILTWGE